jgi:hypothetical protein
MPLILAVEPDRHQASHLASVLRGRPRTELVIAQSARAALDALGGRVPEVLLTSPLLPRNDEEALASWLRELGPAATHVQELTIPILAKAAPAKKPRGGMLSSLRRGSKKSTPDGCEPAMFADHVGEYVSQAMAARPDQEMPAPVAAAPPPKPEPVVVHAMVETEQEFIAPAPLARLQPEPAIAEAMSAPEIEIISSTAFPQLADQPEPVAISALVMPELDSEPEATARVPFAQLPEQEPLVLMMPEPQAEATPVLFAQLPEHELLVVLSVPEPEIATPVAVAQLPEPQPVVIQAIAMPEPEPEKTAPVQIAQRSPWEVSIVEAVEEPVDSVWILMPPPAPVRVQAAAPLPVDDDPRWAALSLEELSEPQAAVTESPVIQDAGEPPWMLMPVPEFHIVEDRGEPASDDAPVAPAVVLLTPLYDLPAETIAPVTGNVPPEVVRMAPLMVAIEPDEVTLTVPAEVRTLPPEVIEIPVDPSATVLVQGPVRAAAAQPPARPARPATQVRPRTNPVRPAVTAAPVRPAATAVPADTSRRRTAAPSKPKRKRPVQDEWGMFDPTQCGFAALLDKLDEVTANSENDEANATVSVRIVSY